MNSKPVNYKEAVEYIESIPKFTQKHTQEHTREFLERLGRPAFDRKVVHVAGTNGKGSVCAYIQAILEAEGKKTGFFTSPHLISINERIQIGRAPIDNEEFYQVFEHVYDVVKKMEEEGIPHPSYFEFLFGMGLSTFERSDVEYIVLETGLGGRLDATVLSNPVLSVITSISYDHTEILGDTIEQIAAEKAGIIKEGIPVVAIDEENGAFSVIERTAKEKNAPVYGLKSQELTILKKCENTIDFSINSRYYKISNLKVKSYASYQVQNAALAVLAVKVLLPEVSQDVIREGIVKMYWPGRMEEIAENVYVDGAHNPGAVHQIYNSLTDSDKEWLLLFAVCSDKDYSEMIRVLGRLPWKRIYITKIDSARGADTAAVKQCFKEEAAGCPIYEDDNARTAFETALKDREYENLLCLGSLYLAGEIKDFATTIF